MEILLQHTLMLAIARCMIYYSCTEVNTIQLLQVFDITGCDVCPGGCDGHGGGGDDGGGGRIRLIGWAGVAVISVLVHLATRYIAI